MFGFRHLKLKGIKYQGIQWTVILYIRFSIEMKMILKVNPEPNYLVH